MQHGQSIVKNCSVILRRYNRNFNYEEVGAVIEELKRCELKIEDARNIEQLMGFEGNAARVYFKALGMLLRDEFKFSGRSKQPPRDKFNSLLSFGYTLLLYEIYTAIINKGLHPYCSFLHKIRKGHPALASDLIEEWRPAIVDSLVTGLVQTGAIREDEFKEPDANGGVYLKKEASKTFIKKFEERLEQQNSYLTYGDYPLSFRESLQFQVSSLVRAIESKDADIYKSVIIR